MARRSFKVDINPAVLVWARESAGFSPSGASAAARQSPAELAAWESGKRKPSWTVLGKLAKLYKRPVAALLLPKPPQEAKPLPDFRILPGGGRQFSPEIQFAIRTARWLAAKAADLQEKLHTPFRAVSQSLDLASDPEEAASAARRTLGISLDEQAGFRNNWQALKRWRAAVEAQQVLVFQLRMPMDDARGFSLVEMQRPAIVLNQSDAPAGRIFTLFHEYAHLLLARPGVCIPTPSNPVTSQRIETFCNRFAAALLLPRADFQVHLPPSPADSPLRRLAGRYSVSRYVVLGRMRDLGAVSAATYQQISLRWRNQEAAAERPPQSGGGLNAPARCLLERGQSFVSLVVEATKRELITLTDANSYLGVKLKDFRKLAKGA